MSGKTNRDHRVAVVTGGAGGIGRAIVSRLAPDHTVVVLDRSGDVVVDLGDTDDVRRAAELVLDRHGRCDVFVHSAATFAFGPFEQVELGAWRQVQAVNVESALLLTQAFVPGMQDRGFGRVIFIVSNTFWSPPDGQMLSYVASKGALIGMARTLAVGLGGDGIAVTAVAPGLTRTPGAGRCLRERWAKVVLLSSGSLRAAGGRRQAAARRMSIGLLISGAMPRGPGQVACRSVALTCGVCTVTRAPGGSPARYPHGHPSMGRGLYKRGWGRTRASAPPHRDKRTPGNR